ncbi:Uncharacterised protein [Legionella feeleii]|uniref:Uncharacterized protein n=1 Tax=Legionella feeleii TaxID=453 RepID=A0A2X1SVQ9_9GAMM|nr:Uncharacterised protein [Legionella feeleii]
MLTVVAPVAIPNWDIAFPNILFKFSTPCAQINSIEFAARSM